MRFCSIKELDCSEGTAQLHGREGELIKHPPPNPNDPNDPLRWAKWKKHVCFFTICSFAFLCNYAIGGLAPAFYPLSLEFDKSMTETSDLLLWPILVLGLFNFFWVPMANYFGKRPILVFSTLLLACANLWGALAKSFESLLWSNIVAAFAGSASEALAQSIVNDVFFLHERANLMGWYMNAISGGNTIGPLICGFVITGTSWRVHKWIAFGLVLLNFLLVIFFVPETRYDRSYLLTAPGTSYSNMTRESFSETRSTKEGAIHATEDGDQPTTDTEKTPASPIVKAIHPAQRNPIAQIPKKTFIQDLSLWSGLPKDANLFTLFLRPLPLIIWPAIILAFLGFAVSLAWVVAINILNSFVLQAPPYNMPPSINGLINIPGLIGNLFGAWIGGWVVDRYCDWRSQKNNGIFEPETRLHLLIVPALIVPAGCLLWGYGVKEEMHWTALFFANGMVGVGLTAVPTMTMTYVSDAYLPVNADALTLVSGLKNILTFGFLHGVVPWVTSAGYVSSFGTQAGVYVLIMALAIPVIIWGKEIRHESSEWRVVLM